MAGNAGRSQHMTPGKSSLAGVNGHRAAVCKEKSGRVRPQGLCHKVHGGHQGYKEIIT
jgi:hypothetical protein